jgi:hypothetical protein
MATTTTRRQRQIEEITALLASGNEERASGLALIHLVEFPDDEALLRDAPGLSLPRT